MIFHGLGNILLNLVPLTRFVFRPVLVADGNFKADHVKQKNDNDVWLIDGAGMVPNQKEYSAFFKKALEIPTVHRFVSPKTVRSGLGSAQGSEAGAAPESECGPVIYFVNVLFSIY